MSDPSNSTEQNLLPVQALFDAENNFQTFIGQGQPFDATISPDQSGLNITSSTINSTTIGATTPSSGVFTSIATTTGQITTAPVSNTDIVNKLYVDSFISGISFKEPAEFGTTGNITLSGLATQGGGDWASSLTAGMRILVKNQTAQAENGVYVAASGSWSRSTDCATWAQMVSALIFIESGNTLASSAWYCTIQSGGTINVDPITWSNFSVSAIYSAGTGLTLSNYEFSITNTGATAATYGSASSVPVVAVNAQGQITSATNTAIAIANTAVSGLGTMSTQNASNVAITGGAINGTTVGATTAAAVTGTTITATSSFSGPGTNLSGTASGLSIGGNAATATSATTATNIAGGSAGSVPYQSATNTTALLAAGSNGQVLTLASGVPSWATPTTGTVTSVGGTGTVSGISLSGSVTTSGNLNLGGTLDLSTPPAIGGTTANTITGTTITASTKFVGSYYDASGSGGGALRTAAGAACLQWGAADAVNLTLDGPFNMNPANATISIAPTGTGTLTVNPATAGTMNNVAIGGTTAAAGSFTTLAVSSTVSANGSVGSSGQVLTSAGAGSAAVWSSPSSNITITDDTTTNATRYPLFSSVTTGSISTEYTSSTKYQFNPSTGVLTSTSFSGDGTGLTGTASSLSIGGNAATVTNGVYTTGTYSNPSWITSILGSIVSGNISGNAANVTGVVAASNGGTGVSGSITGVLYANGTSAATAATGAEIVSIIGSSSVTNATNAANIATSDTSTNATYYPTFVSATGGNQVLNTTSTKLKFNPSTGALTASQLIIAP